MGIHMPAVCTCGVRVCVCARSICVCVCLQPPPDAYPSTHPIPARGSTAAPGPWRATTCRLAGEGRQGSAIGRIGCPRLLCSITTDSAAKLPSSVAKAIKRCPCWRVSDRSQCESPSACCSHLLARDGDRREPIQETAPPKGLVPQPGGRRRPTTQSDTVLTDHRHTDMPTDYDLRHTTHDTRHTTDRQATCTSPSHLLLASPACFCGLPL